MISEQKIKELAEKHLHGGPLYLTGVKINPGSSISLTIDGDEGVKIDDCVSLSRAIEAMLDRDKEDFSLVVSSHGAGSPIILARQFLRHKGRTLTVKVSDGSRAEGILTDCSGNSITLEYEERVNKPVGKGKVTVKKTRTIEHNRIKEARIKLKF